MENKKFNLEMDSNIVVPTICSQIGFENVLLHCIKAADENLEKAISNNKISAREISKHTEIKGELKSCYSNILKLVSEINIMAEERKQW